PPQCNKAAATKQLQQAAQQTSRNKAAATKPAATKAQEADPKPGQPLFHLRQPESPISPP
ncbi:MAG: hypothetical protein PUJ44_08860, partial [Bacteroidales bacterium]|nr:hypothetical protein [Bacteroidales bacterium]